MYFVNYVTWAWILVSFGGCTVYWWILWLEHLVVNFVNFDNGLLEPRHEFCELCDLGMNSGEFWKMNSVLINFNEFCDHFENYQCEVPETGMCDHYSIKLWSNTRQYEVYVVYLWSFLWSLWSYLYLLYISGQYVVWSIFMSMVSLNFVGSVGCVITWTSTQETWILLDQCDQWDHSGMWTIFWCHCVG